MPTKTETEIKTKLKTKEPDYYNLIFFNDDKTTFEFVTFLLTSVVGLSLEDAYNKTINIHEKGQEIILVAPKFVIEKMEEKIKDIISKSGYPLKVKSEKA